MLGLDTGNGVAQAQTAPPERSGPGVSKDSQLKMVTVARASLHDIDTSQVIGPDGVAMQAKKDPYLGCTIDARYKVESLLGEGGMGRVYLCSHTIIGKRVAMKVLLSDMARDKEVTERFLNEAKSASAIGNPHIIDISDFGQFPDGAAYFVMEFLDGVPLTNAVEEGKAVPVSRILNIARQLAEGLSAAHEAGIVHRDLKPDNIFLISRGSNKDFVKILDFGIAKVSTSGEGRLTKAGAVFGTPHYMSPEQAAGAPVDHRGDIYSFGVILYELASGKVPFDADNFMGILTQHMYKAPVPIRALVPQPQEVPPGLEAIVLKCLSKRPEQRYQTMDELLQDLDKLDSGAIPSAVPEMMNRSGGFNVPSDYFKKGGGMPAPVPAMPLGAGRATRRWPVFAGIAGVVTAIVLVVAIFAKSRDSTAKPTPQPAATPEKTAAPVATKTAKAPPVPAGPDQKQIVIAVEPIDAHVFNGDEDLGTSPVLLNVDVGDTVEVEIRRDGFRTKKLEVDASQLKRSIKLERIPGVRARPVPKKKKPTKRDPPKEKPPAPQPKPTLGDPSIVNPWGE